MTKTLCSACLGLGVALLVLDLGYTVKGWSLGPAALTLPLQPARHSSLTKTFRALLDKLRGSEEDLLLWEEIAFSLACHMRAGETVAQSLKGVAGEGTGTPYKLLKRTCHEYEAGVPVLAALDGVASGNPEFVRLAAVFELGLVNGGDLPALLCRAAEELRRLRKRQREVKSKLVEARLTALLLTFLPWGIGFFTFRQDPRIGQTLVKDPQGRLLFLASEGRCSQNSGPLIPTLCPVGSLSVPFGVLVGNQERLSVEF